ncbi:hypothetical protein OCD90_27615 [Bacillus pacificus]|uniref:hypothetical protein n=1 Tax=Bacillus TaxID=1386 RepID=UPI0003482C35|nr:hypothetical protein [Bacillus pacificus]MCC2419572.1 hypothetical protein [Bacillus pacificus]MCU5008821.1 hypothetical protein [Bacillus pacificus]MCU5259509.1 hypothetical protein [Bacillus pacificus]MCU5562039.1 hypothetical protein [Bacillus pacificus]
MANAVKPINQVRQKISKADRAARQEAEVLVVTDVKTKPKTVLAVSKLEKKLFGELSELNDNYAKVDSISLTMLSKNMYRMELLSERLEELDPMEERATDLEKRIQAFERSVTAHMKDLCIPLTQRLRMANDRAKVMIEEKKLEHILEQQPQDVNPLIDLLKKFE